MNKHTIEPRVVTAEMIESLPELYKIAGWRYVKIGKWVLKKPEDVKQ
jgi:hypothetical protein